MQKTLRESESGAPSSLVLLKELTKVGPGSSAYELWIILASYFTSLSLRLSICKTGTIWCVQPMWRM